MGSSSAALEKMIDGDPDAVHIISTLSCQHNTSVHDAADTSESSPSPSKPAVQWSVFKDADVDAEDKSESRKLEMLKVLQSRECVKLEPLVLNRDSFTETAANILTLSVLVKDGLAQVRLASDQSYIIVPRRTTDAALKDDDTKSIFQLNYKDWESMRKQVQASEELMAHENAPFKWPAVIPKGIRQKARRRRTCFKPGDGTLAQAENRNEEGATSSADPELSAPGYQDFKPHKALLTYSRRREKRRAIPGQADPKEMLVKRYTRRVLNGEIYVEKTFVFQELVPTKKPKVEAEGLFETPKQRRQPGLYTPVSTSTSTGEGCTLAVYTKAALEGVESGDAMIIAPKRFKKSSGLRPRHVAIAQIKAKLKALLNKQAPLK
ncbi:hypothetical protein SELMODRAFT_438111 [Selaginella moellendorffii]|uniref:Non-structural maintenance of chromosomes element 4 n=1 Tax=Selaginella moellendorffii TaxID=88036 RepID=D8QU69_SELML|nr:hypothetical protein SELMODRAFT_438111 [Selaginella moellendorffii]